MESIFHRVSIRRYTEQMVEDEKLEKLMRAAMAAPSACNQQPWEFYIVTNKEKIQQLATATKYATPCKNAPVVIVPCFRKDSYVVQYAPIDMSASVENLLLEADALGLGAVWMGVCPQVDRMEVVGEMLGLPENLSAFALISVGYPAESRKQQDRYETARVHFVK